MILVFGDVELAEFDTVMSGNSGGLIVNVPLTSEMSTSSSVFGEILM